MEESDLRNGFGAEIRRLRNLMGFSQEELGERADLHRTYVSDVEAGRRNPSLASIQRLAQALDSTVGGLFSSIERTSALPASRLSSSPPEILLIENDPAELKAALASFKEAKLANPIEIARDGAQALEFLFRSGPQAGRVNEPLPILILLDLALPKVSGLEVLRRIKADPHTRSCRVVVLAASERDPVVREACLLGAEACIPKPLGFQSLGTIAPLLKLRWTLLGPRIP